MAEQASQVSFHLQPEDNEALNALCGQLDAHIALIEKHYDVTLAHRSHLFTCTGDPQKLQACVNAVQALFQQARASNTPLNPQSIELSLLSFSDGKNNNSDIKIRTRRGYLKPKSAQQAQYIDNIRRHDVNFGIGPAGTGKTWLAVACAVEALERDDVRRIVLVRPAVEAGERLGFLPGDLTQKIDPYLRPMYDALYEMLGVEKVTRLIERSTIEIAPLAFMRGRTLNDSFILLDEAQNTSCEQMQMFLTRLGFGSTAVITGDLTQIDLPKHQISGLKHAAQVLEGVAGISFTQFGSRDVVRHQLVQRIVDAYAAHKDD